MICPDAEDDEEEDVAEVRRGSFCCDGGDLRRQRAKTRSRERRMRAVNGTEMTKASGMWVLIVSEEESTTETEPWLEAEEEEPGNIKTEIVWMDK